MFNMKTLLLGLVLSGIVTYFIKLKSLRNRLYILFIACVLFTAEKLYFGSLTFDMLLLDAFFLFLFSLIFSQSPLKRLSKTDLLYFAFFHFVYNILLLSIHFTKSFVGDSSLATPTLVHTWGIVFYYFSYFEEFAKRSLIGTFFQFFHIEPNFQTVFLFAILLLNLFYTLFYLLVYTSFSHLSKKTFYLFLLFFILSPVTVMQRGLYILFFDNFNLIITTLIIYSLIRYTTHLNLFLIPFLITIGILNHEAFLLINFPLIFAILINEYMQKRVTIKLLTVTLITVVFMSIIIVLYGSIDNPSVFQHILSHLPVQSYTPAQDVFQSWQRSLYDNYLITVAELKPFTLKSMLPVLVVTLLYFFLLLNILQFNKLTLGENLVLFSPFGMLPLFIIAHDFARFFALMTFMMFFAFIYMVSYRKEPLHLSKGTYFILILLSLTFFLGPFGVMTGFPYILGGRQV